MSLRSVILRLNAATYTVQRRAAGSYDAAGQYEPGALTTLSIVADVQPLDGKSQDDNPDGSRSSDRLLVITTTELYTVREGQPDASEYGAPGRAADRILIDGEWYVVTKVETWRSFGSVHYECEVARQSKGA